MTKSRQLIAAGIAALTLGTAAAAGAATVIVQKPHKTIVLKEKGRYIARERVLEVVRARHIRVVGQPYMYRGAYVVKCFDRSSGRVAFCRINPRTGTFLGVTVRL